MRIKTIAAALAATGLLALGASSANAGIGFRDRPVVLQPSVCADLYEDSLNQFVYAGTNTPIKWSGGVRSCSTGGETVHVHFELSGQTAPADCVVPAFDSAAVTLKSGETKGLSAQAPEPPCEGYYFFRVTVVDANGVNAAPNGGSVDYTVHVAVKQ